MLGANADLRDIPERVGYDRVFLGIEDSLGTTFTLERSTSGGQYRRHEGLTFGVEQDHNPQMLSQKHNPTNEDNLSMYLLQKIGLSGKRIRRNARGETNTLSFRNLARLCLIPEGEIQKQGSPILSGIPTNATSEFSTFKLLVTGVDDSAVQSTEPDKNRRLSNSAKIEVIEELITDYRDRLAGLIGEEDDEAKLRAQLSRLEQSINKEREVLEQSEEAYRDAVSRRNHLRQELNFARERHSEVTELLARFRLLDSHYRSDLERLEGIREAGVLISALDNQDCPLCGASPNAQHLNAECDGNVDAVVAAVEAERIKTARLQTELRDTIRELEEEDAAFIDVTPKIEGKLDLAVEAVTQITPSVSEQRSAYAEFMNKRSTVQNALNLLASIGELEERKAEIDASEDIPGATKTTSTDVSHSTLDEFSRIYEEILKSWNFPKTERVFFDNNARDWVIAGKPRGARGKGMRAITYAAFTVALLEYTKVKDLPHPGFVVIDTPLLAYREPEGEEDNLEGTDVDNKFYGQIAKIKDRQVIILENRDPPEGIRDKVKATFFSKNVNVGRYGFF